MKTWSQLKAVLKKSYLIKTKTPIWSLVEMFLPVILLWLMTQFDEPLVVENLFRPFLCLIYSTAMAGLVAHVVTEREQRISEMMKILGLPSWIFYVSWFIYYTIVLGITSLLVALVMVFGNVMPEGSVELIFLYYVLYSTSSIAFSLFLSTPFDSSKVAQTVAFLVYSLVSMAGSLPDITWGTEIRMIVTLFLPPMGFSLGLKASSPKGMTWSNMSDEKENFSVTYAIAMMFCATIFYMLLFVYFDQVLPHAVGTRRPWYFPFVRNAAANKDVSEEALGLVGTSVVETKALSKRYDASRQALFDVDLKLHPGELTVLLGRNGAGKTTLINILTGMTEASSGTARVFGHSVNNDLEKVRENLGFCPQHDIQWQQLTVEEHFEIFGAFRNIPPKIVKERMNRLLANIGLVGKESAPAGTLSGGMKRKLSVALSFLGDSKFIILDEPTSGLDPLSRRHMWTVLGKMREDRVVLLSTHYMDEAEVLGERVVILSDGQVRANGSVNELKREFDCGYELAFSLADSDLAALSRFQEIVVSVVKYAKIEIGNSGKAQNTVIVTMPVDAGAQVPLLLATLEKNFDQSSGLGRQVGIKSKRLEEVFMSIALDGEVEEIILPPLEEDLVQDSDEEEGLKPPSVAGQEKIEFEKGKTNLLIAQIFGTFLKRWRLFFREIRVSLMQNLFPFFMIMLGLTVVKLGDKGANFKEGSPEETIRELTSEMTMIGSIQFAFTSISSGIVSSLSRESLSMSKFLQYVAGLTPLAYWIGSFAGDVMEYFALPFAYTAIAVAAMGLTMPLAPLFLLLASFGPGVIAQTYALTVLVTNPVMSRFVSFMVSCIIGFILPFLFALLRITEKAESLVPGLTAVCRVFPSFNLGDGIFSLGVYSIAQRIRPGSSLERLPAATAESVYAYDALGAPIIWMLAMTPALLMIAMFVDDLRYKHKMSFFSENSPNQPSLMEVSEDESVARERAKVHSGGNPGSLALRAVDVSKQWVPQGPLAVNNVPLAVARNGEIFTLLGENGAGKTTLMTMAIGQILPSHGDIFIDKFNTRTELKQARQLIGYCPQFDALLLPLTVKDHLRLFARIKGVKPASINVAVRRTIDWLGLKSYENAKAKSLSGGYKRRLSLAIALMGRPEILILDEPSCGMDPVARRQMWQVMESASRDCALILTTHSMEEAESVSTRLGIMSKGKMVCVGTASELREKYSNGVEIFIQTKVPNTDDVDSLQIGSIANFIVTCQAHSHKRANRFVSSGMNIILKENSDPSVATAFAEWWAQENLNDEIEAMVHSKISGIVSNFEASGRSIRFVAESSNKLITFDFISEMFAFLEDSKKRGFILDYSVTQNSLDQVFRSIASREQVADNIMQTEILLE